MHLPLPLFLLSILALTLQTTAQPFPRHKALHALHHRHHHAHPPAVATELQVPNAEAREPELDTQQGSANSELRDGVVPALELRKI